MERDSILIVTELGLKSLKSKGFPAKRLLVECKASERNRKVQLGVNIARAAIASRWPASCCALLQSSHLLQLQ